MPLPENHPEQATRVCVVARKPGRGEVTTGSTFYRYPRRQPPPLPSAESLPFPSNLVRQCSDCDLRAGCNAPVPGDGSIPAKVLFVGEAPGRNEDEWGRPFIGQAGQQLDSLLFQIGVSREGVYITNTVHCRPPNNRDPKPVETKACAKWLNIELSLVDPDIIVAMGAPAITWFLGQGCGTVEHLHSKPIEVTVGSRKRIVLPCYHPAAALRNTTLLRQLYGCFQVLRGLVKDVGLSEYLVRDEYPEPDYRLADTPAKLNQMANEVAGAGECAVDVETVERDTKLWSVQLSTQPGTAWFFPAGSDYKGRLDLTKWGSATRFIVHYYLNDINWLDIPDNRFMDTMIQAYLLGLPQGLKELASRLCGINMVSYSEVVRPGQRRLSLDYLTRASKMDWPDPPDIEETKWDNRKGMVITRIKKPWHISRKIARILADTVDSVDVDPYWRWMDIPGLERAEVERKLEAMPESSLVDIKFDDAVQYACRDSDATLRVKHKMDKLISQLGLDFTLLMDLSILPMVYEMMQTGMAVDLDHFRNLSTDYDARMRAKAAELASVVGHPFNPNSSQQVARVIYTELGFQPTRLTPSKEISTDDSELKKTKHPVAKGIIEYRRLSKMKGTYADALVGWAVPDDEGVPRVHTTLKTTRTETGRLASADPNLQNVPVRGKEGKVIRLGFTSPLGWLLGEGDLAQIEMCTQAHLARCKGLIDVFLRGGDVHTETAARIFGVSLEDAKQEKYRYPTKRANYGVIYLIGPRGLSNQIQEYVADLEMEGEQVDIEPWDVPTCEKYIGEWYQLYPEVKDYQLEMAAMARRYGYVKDLFGRVRYIPEVSCPIRWIQEAGLRQAANLPVTASAQGIIKLAMGALWRELPRTEWRDSVRWLMQIHDSLIVEMVEDDEFVRDCLGWIRQVMCGVVKLAVPVRVDFKTGKRWTDLEKYELDVRE